MRVGVLEKRDADRWNVVGGGDQVVGELVVRHRSLPPLAFLHERPADPLDHAALDLSLGKRRIEHLADLLHRHEVDDARGARPQIHLDFGDVGSPRECAVGVTAVRRVVPGDAGRPLVGRLADQRLSRMLAVPPANRLLHRRTAGRVVEPHATPQIVRRPLEQAAYDHGGAGRHGGARVRDPCRVGFGDGHVFGRDAQPCRRELGEDRQGPLAHLDVGAQHFDPAVGPARHTHPRLERDLAAAGEPRAVIERGEPGAAAQRGVGRVEGGVPSLLFPVAGELQRPLHHGQAIRAVLDDLTGGGGLAVGQQIDAP